MSKLTYAARAGAAIAAQPFEGVERVLETLATRRDWRRNAPYRPTPQWEQQLHTLLVGDPSACDEHDAFEEVWQTALDDLAEQELAVGRGTFGGWDDGDVRLARIAWCLTRHLRPERIVETGVARGLTTRVLLE